MSRSLFVLWGLLPVVREVLSRLRACRALERECAFLRLRRTIGIVGAAEAL